MVAESANDRIEKKKSVIHPERLILRHSLFDGFCRGGFGETPQFMVFESAKNSFNKKSAIGQLLENMEMSAIRKF